MAAVVEATGDDEIVIADANGGYRLQDAVVAARLLEDMPRTFYEQPCASLEECLYVRRLTTLPMILDESITDVQSLLRAWSAERHGGDQPQGEQGRRADEGEAASATSPRSSACA